MSLSLGSLIFLSLVHSPTIGLSQSNTNSNGINFPSSDEQGLNKYERINLIEERLKTVAEKLNQIPALEAKIKELESRLSSLESTSKKP